MWANAEGPEALACACADAGVRLVTFSSDLVFDGSLGRAYVESDPPRALNVYGSSKLEGERRVLAHLPQALVIRTSAFFGPVDEYNFLTIALDTIARGEVMHAASDAVVSPTYVPDLADAALDLLIDGEEGIWHVANAGQVTWYELAVAAARAAGLDESLVRPVPTAQLGLRAARPLFSALASERGALLPPLEHAIARYVRDRYPPDRRRIA